MEAIQGIALRGYRLENIHVGYKRDLADIPPVIEEKNIRPYKSEDRNSLLNLDKQTFPSMNLEPAELTSWQERGEGVILVSPGEGGLNGFVILEIYGEKMQYCFVRSLAVAPEARGEGLGKELLLKALLLAREKGAGKCMLWVDYNNKIARRMYEKLEFQLDENESEAVFRV